MVRLLGSHCSKRRKRKEEHIYQPWGPIDISSAIGPDGSVHPKGEGGGGAQWLEPLRYQWAKAAEGGALVDPSLLKAVSRMKNCCIMLKRHQYSSTTVVFI